ncbi:unnamed protein product [Debaryomyces tyrocola]|nr:unnamed protein product [Debaryomyces tyrocola]
MAENSNKYHSGTIFSPMTSHPITLYIFFYL